MKRVLILIGLIGAFLSNASAQEIDTVRLKVASFKELQDCYIISAVMDNKPDTVYLISVKNNRKAKTDYEKICIGKLYSFVRKNLTAQLAAMPANSFAIRIKNTIVWTGNEDIKKRPFLALNTQNLYIKEINK